MFTRIYTGILASVLLAALLSYALYYFADKDRRSDYEHSALSGVMRLVGDGLQRQNAGTKTRYLDIVARLLGANVSRLTATQLADLAEGGLQMSAEGKVINLPTNDSSIRWLLMRPDQTAVQVQIAALSEQQFRAHALLFVSELSRSDRAISVKQLQDYSTYPLSIQALSELRLDEQQRSRLARGAVVVGYDSVSDNSFSVYAPLKGEQIVVLGPIPQFDSLPLSIVFGMIAITSLVIVTMSYWLVSRLEQRLNRLSGVVRAFGKGDLQARVVREGNDSIAVLSDRINAMASRIETLLQGQRDIMQAVSHELRTPLARIRFRLGILDDEKADELILRRTDAIRRDINELEQLIDEVLEHHQLTQLPDLPKEPVVIAKLLERVQGAFAELSPDIRITCEGDSEAILHADGASLHRLLSNLVSNACKHAKSEVRIRQFDNGAERCLSVEDDGDGIPPEEWENIFQPFYRVDNSRNKKIAGYGLGLAIVDRIARLHGARISLVDSALGGVGFVVSFPAPSGKSEVKER